MVTIGKDSNEESIILEEDEEEVDNPAVGVEEPLQVEEIASAQQDGEGFLTKEVPKDSDKTITDQISKSSKDDIIIDEQITNTKTSLGVPPIPKPKEISALRMHLGKEEIEAMISEGTLEKVSEGYYKMKAEKLKDLKICSETLPIEKSPPKKVKPCPLSKKPKTKESSPPRVSLLSTPTPVTIATGSTVTTTQIAASPFVHQTPSYIALMPVNQSSGNSGGSALLALPVQQNVPVSYNPGLPTFVAISQNIAPSSSVPQAVSEASIPSVAGCAGGSSNVTSSLPQEPLQQASVAGPSTSTPSLRLSTRSSTAVNETPSTSAEAPITSTGVKRKPHFESTKVKKPYKYAKPVRKKRKTADRVSDFVSDLNSSDDDDFNAVTKSRVYGMELASMFFKKIGESKKRDKSLLDKLHKAIFEDSNTETEHESDESDMEAIASQVTSGKSSYQTVTCPGPGKFEVFVGPGHNSKLSIIRSQETKVIKNFMYEVYRVRVTSSGREANTNILIPVPEGYKFHSPKGKEEYMEFAHVAHEDPAAINYVSPRFLEKLASTELKLRKYKDEIKVLRRRYLELLQEYANRPQFSTLSDLVGAASKFLTEDQLVFFLMQLKAGAHNMQGIRYSVREKVLALSIYQRSPEVYKWFRKLFNLPSKRVLDQWLEDIGNQDPQLLKKLMYYIYTTYNFKAVA